MLFRIFGEFWNGLLDVNQVKFSQIFKDTIVISEFSEKSMILKTPISKTSEWLEYP